MCARRDRDHNRSIDRRDRDPTVTAAKDSGTDDTLASGATDDTLASGQAAGTTLPTDSLIDRYVVQGELGRGGMGVVYRALDPDLNRTIAIKMLRARDGGMTEDARRRMVREGQAIAQLSHPNVVSVFDVGIHEDDIFIAMEYVDGGTLSDWLEPGRSRAEIIDVMTQAGRGLAAAHELGIIHRDFKSDNVLIGKDGRVRVLDFGLARVVSEDDDDGESPGDSDPVVGDLTETVTVAGSIMGTPAYMPPEQFRGHRADARADQFSFTVTLFEALFGERPFQGDGFEDLRDKVTTGDRAAVPAAAQAPSWLRALIDRGLATEPDDRYDTMDEVVEELSRPRKSRWPVVAVGATVIAAAAVAVVFAVRDKGETAPAAAPTLEPTLREVVRESGVHLHPSLTPDGNHVVYTDQTDILIRDLRTDRPESVVNVTRDFEPAATEPQISPNGELIAFSAQDAVYLIPFAGGAPRKLAERGFWPTFSPDSKHVAYVTEDRYSPWIDMNPNEPELWRVDLSSGQRTLVIDTELTATQPDWSPDGERLVFASGNHFMTVRADGSDVRGTGITTANHPLWNATSDGLYAIEELGGQYRIVLFELDTATWAARSKKSKTVVSASPNPVWHFDISDDARKIVTAVHRSSFRTYKFGFDPSSLRATSAPVPFSDPVLGLISPAISADGQWLVFSSLGSSDEDLYVMKVDGTEGRRLLRGNEYRRSPAFSPVDRSVIYDGTENGTWGIHRIQFDGTKPEVLSTDGTHRAPHWSPDGKRLAVSASPDDSVSFPYIVVADQPWLEQGIEQHNPKLGGYRTGPWSPDGRWVALMSKDGLARMNSSTLAVEHISPRGSDVAWLSDSRRLVAVEGDQLFIHDTETGKQTDVLSLAPARATELPSVEVTPDDKTIFVSTNYEQASVWFIELRERK